MEGFFSFILILNFAFSFDALSPDGTSPERDDITSMLGPGQLPPKSSYGEDNMRPLFIFSNSVFFLL